MWLISMLTDNWIAIIQILIIIYVTNYYFNYYTRQSPIPGPFPLPLIGNLHQVGLNPAKFAVDHHKKFGDMFELWVGSKRLIFLSRPSLVDQIYAPGKTSNFFTRIPISLFQKNGILFNDDYQSWKRNRKFVVQALMSPRFLRQFTQLAQSLFIENEGLWDQKGYHMDFAEWVKCFTTDIILHTVTCKPSYCLRAYLFGEESEEIQASIRFVQAVRTFLHTFVFQVNVPETLKNYFPGFYNLNQKYKRNLDWLNKTILNNIKKRKLEISSDEMTSLHLIDLLLMLNNSNDHSEHVEDETPDDHNEHVKDETPMTDQEICSILVDVCVTGTETTGNTFCFTVWLLTHHPKVLARFREEIKDILGDDKSRQITYEDLEKFTYLDAIIKESTRVLPLIPISPRTSAQESIVGGKKWNANTIFFINHELIGKSPEFWKDPDQFIPERFLKESGNEISKNSFIPFGGGIRICPGRHVTVVQLKTLLILLYRKYDVELVDKKSKKPKIRYLGSNVCSEMKVILRPQKE